MKKRVNCSFFQEHMNAYLDSELDQETRSAMISHADECPDCSERLETMTRLLMMCAELDEGLSVPLDVQSAWRHAIRREAAGKQVPSGRNAGVRRRKPNGLVRAVSAVAAAAVLLAGGTVAYRLSGAAPASTASSQLFRSVNSAEETSAKHTGEFDLMAAPSGTLIEVDGEVDDVVMDGQGTLEMGAGQAGDAAAHAPSGTEQPKVVLRSASRAFETSTFDQTVDAISGLVDEYAGYFESEETYGRAMDRGQNGRYASMTARVPTDELDAFLTALDAVGTVTSKSETQTDISDRYYDAAGRLETYKTQLTKYNQLVSTATGLEDMLLLQGHIDETQAMIDSVQGQINGWDSRVARSTVNISVTEIAVREQQALESDLGERVRAALDDSIEWVKAFLQDAAVVLAMAAPALVIIIPLLIVIWVIVAAVRRSRRRRGR